MNPNIRALALKAGQNNGAQHAIDIPVWFLERFALLIVQECCDVLHDNEMGGYQVNYLLKEHFEIL